jgi:fibronectin-binding autotransporter adhesin
VSTVPGWGTHLLNGTPLYLGQLQAWAGGNGNWSSHSWGNGSAWVDGGQATFSNADQVITVDGVPKISGIQFEANNVTLSGGSLNFTSGGGSIYTAGGNATIRSVVAGGGDPASGTCSNTVASTFCLRKSGAGTLTLSGSNAFVGGVLVGQGTLIISGTIRSATAISLGGTLLQNSSTPLTNSIAFADGATFGGTGTYTGNLSPGGGHLSPGSGGVGVFTQEGNLTLSSTSVLDYDFGTTAGSCDRWSFSGSGRSIVLDGTLNIHVAGPVAEGRYTIISGATSVTDSGLKFGDVPANRKWSYEVLKNGGLYDVVVIAVGATATKGQ